MILFIIISFLCSDYDYSINDRQNQEFSVYFFEYLWRMRLIKVWYNEIKEFYMQKFIQAYIEKLDVTTIIENILTKVISLLLLLIVFYIAKKMLHTMVQRIVKPSLKCLIMMSDAKRLLRVY